MIKLFLCLLAIPMFERHGDVYCGGRGGVGGVGWGIVVGEWVGGRLG